MVVKKYVIATHTKGSKFLKQKLEPSQAFNQDFKRFLNVYISPQSKIRARVFGKKADLVGHIAEVCWCKVLEEKCTYNSICIHPPKHKNIFFVIYLCFTI